MPTTHGQAKHNAKTRTYRIWQKMLKRCRDPKDKAFHRYGGRGIAVCSEWQEFGAFFGDMGECPKGLTLERRNNDLGYSKGNCRWATRAEQMTNTSVSKRITFDGETLCQGEWERRLGLGVGTLSRRLKRGETIPYALRKADERHSAAARCKP